MLVNSLMAYKANLSSNLLDAGRRMSKNLTLALCSLSFLSA